MSELRFEHVVIDADPPGAHHDITLLHDLTGSGLPDISAASRGRPTCSGTRTRAGRATRWRTPPASKPAASSWT